MKIAVITSISGINNKLINPSKVFDNVDYHAFVDNITDNSIWTQHKNIDFTIDNRYKGRRNAKIYKILPNLFLPNYDYYFWVDSTHEVVMNPFHVVDKVINNSDIALFKHPQRNCVYDEANELIKLSYDHVNLIMEQKKFYEKNNYPKNNGLFELPCSIRKNTEIINRMNLMWWEIICRYSSRDQISLPFVLDKLKIKPHILDGCANCGLYGNNIIPQVRNKYY